MWVCFSSLVALGLQVQCRNICVNLCRPYGNVATEYHLGLLKAKLAKYRSQLLEPSKKSGEKGEGFDVLKSGDARVALIGFPSVGKVNDFDLWLSIKT